MTRDISRRYDDPLDVVWLTTAQRLGMRVERAHDVFASWDGAGTLHIGSRDQLDRDDTLAQMILHEVCHALVEGPDAFGAKDWGLCNHDGRHLPHEHAAQRLQAALADTRGLRRFLAVTTDFRPYYDALPNDPLADGPDPAIPLARAGWERARRGPWAQTLDEALDATAVMARTVAPFADEPSLWRRPD